MITYGDFDLHGEAWEKVPADCKDLIQKLLIVNPNERIKISKIMRHPWLMSKEEIHAEK